MLNKVRALNMNETEFTYWLQGFFELSNAEELTRIKKIWSEKS